MWRVLPVLLLVAVAAANPQSIDVGGAYESNWDNVQLVQDGKYVHGSYVCCGGGRIEGRIYEGRIIRYHWKQPGGEGEGVWEIVAPDKLEGTWGSGQSDDDGGRWDLVRKSSLAN